MCCGEKKRRFAMLIFVIEEIKTCMVDLPSQSL